LTLVSAPAGFGKTTLLTDWLTTAPTNGHATAWLSLDRSDNDPALFWAYFIAALKAAAPGVGNGALALLPSTQSPTEAFVVTLLNDLAAVSIHVVVVLDDYHVIEDPGIRDAANSSRSGPPICASRSTRPRRISTTSWHWS
jgi:LuxR family maltose regulon positive regulatory protein